MSSTMGIQGIDVNAKPSSRVMQEPGGKSNNIFSFDEPTTKSKKVVSVTPPYAAGNDEAAPAASKTGRDRRNPSTESAIPNSAPPPPQQKRGTGRNNPITGEVMYETAPKSSTKVAQPPGGRSSISF